MAEGYVDENGRIRRVEPPELEDPPLPPPANADDDRDEEETEDDDDEEEGDEFARAASADHGLRRRQGALRERPRRTGDWLVAGDSFPASPGVSVARP